MFDGEGQHATGLSVSNSDYSLNYFWTLDGTEIASSNSKTLTITKVGREHRRFSSMLVTRDDSKDYNINEVDFAGVSPRSVLRFEDISQTIHIQHTELR